MNKAFVAGVGMIPFAKPGASDPYDVMAAKAGRLALADAGIVFEALQQAYVGYVYGDSTSGQKAVYALGMTGIPIFNVNNNCSTGSTALFLARQAIESGAAECVLALGFEQMNPGALGTVFNDRPSPFEDFDREAEALVGMPELPLALRYFGGAGLAHMQKYGTPLEAFAQVRAKASRHAARNPLALLRRQLSVDDVMDAPMLWPGVLTRLMACPPTCGAAAAVLVSEKYAKSHGLRTDVFIAAQAMTTDRPDSFESHDMMKLVGYGMSRAAARQCLRRGRHRPRRPRRGRAARLFRAERVDQLRSAGPVCRGRGRGIHRRGRQQLRGPGRDESVRRPVVQRPSAGRDRPGAMLRADPSAARQRGAASGAPRSHWLAAQPGPRRRLRGDAVSVAITRVTDEDQKLCETPAWKPLPRLPGITFCKASLVKYAALPRLRMRE